MKPCIKYDAEKWSDGAGAQIQRIAAIYSISQEFKLNYIHQDILHIESNPGDGFESLKSKTEFISKLNRKFRISSNICSRTHSIKTLKYRRIMKYRLTARLYFISVAFFSFLSGKHFLYKCENPYPIIENYPNIYRHFTHRLGTNERSSEKTIEIQMHIRSNKSGNALMESRSVEISWYVDILKFIDDLLLNLGLKYRVTIHTDAPLEQINWKPLDLSAATEKFWKSADVMQEDRGILLNPIDFKNEFKFVEKLEVVRNIDPVQAWEMMSMADVLILGRSSFSFVAGLVNNHGIIIAPTFRHKFPGGWLMQGKEIEFTGAHKNQLEECFISHSTRIGEVN